MKIQKLSDVLQMFCHSIHALIVKYKISEGKVLGDKLRMIEEEWVNNNFKISDQQVENIVNN